MFESIEFDDNILESHALEPMDRWSGPYQGWINGRKAEEVLARRLGDGNTKNDSIYLSTGKALLFHYFSLVVEPPPFAQTLILRLDPAHRPPLHTVFAFPAFHPILHFDPALRPLLRTTLHSILHIIPSDSLCFPLPCQTRPA